MMAEQEHRRNGSGQAHPQSEENRAQPSSATPLYLEHPPEGAMLPNRPQPRHRRADATNTAAQPIIPHHQPTALPQQDEAKPVKEILPAGIDRPKHAHHPLADQKPRRNWTRYALLALCAGVFLFAAGSLISYGLDYLHTRQVSDEMRSLYHEETEETAPPQAAATVAAADPTPEAEERASSAVTPDPTDAPALNTSSNALRTTPAPYAAAGNPSGKFTKLQSKNSEIIGWLTIEGVVDEPVVKRDNTYYLTHNYLKQRSDTGALFMDQHISLYPAPESIVIHGHNMKTGAMFGSLKKYKVKGTSFLQQAGFVQLDTVMESARYVVFAVVVADIRPTESDFLNFCGQLSFRTDALFEAYVERVRTLSMVYVPIDIQPGDRLLTLSTCAGDDENDRLLIVCRMLRPDEDELSLNYALAHATNR